MVGVSTIVWEGAVQSHIDLYQRLKNDTWCLFAEHSAL